MWEEEWVPATCVPLKPHGRKLSTEITHKEAEKKRLWSYFCLQDGWILKILTCHNFPVLALSSLRLSECGWLHSSQTVITANNMAAIPPLLGCSENLLAILILVPLTLPPSPPSFPWSCVSPSQFRGSVVVLPQHWLKASSSKEPKLSGWQHYSK